jgi:exopolysaccharide biosynthesis predicted pyruvyltransferase EpsI
LLFGNSYVKGKHAYIDWLEHVHWINYTDETDVERIEELLQQLISQKWHNYDVKNDFRQLRDLIKNNMHNKN